MTNFERMRYLHRNTVKKKAAASEGGNAGKKEAKRPSRKTAGDKKGAADEECGKDPAENVPG